MSTEEEEVWVRFDDRVPDGIYFEGEGTTEKEEYALEWYSARVGKWVGFDDKMSRWSVRELWKTVDHSEAIYRVIKKTNIQNVSVMEWKSS